MTFLAGWNYHCVITEGSWSFVPLAFFGIVVKGVKLNECDSAVEWTSVTFEHVPNAYDPDSVAVYARGQHLGHVQCEASSLMALLLTGPFNIKG